MKLTFKTCNCTTEWSFYEDQSLCLVLACYSARPINDGRFLTVATSPSELRREADEILVKTQGEHETLVPALIDAGVVRPFWMPVYLGAQGVLHARCRLTTEAVKDAFHLN